MNDCLGEVTIELNLKNQLSILNPVRPEPSRRAQNERIPRVRLIFSRLKGN